MRMRSLCVLLAVAGCDKVLELHHFNEPAYRYKKPITITQDTGTTLVDFPVSITLAADPDLVAHASPTGADLGFADGTQALASEIVHYDAGTLEAWVKVASLPPGSTTIELLYGGPDAAHADPVWPATAVGVWHLSELGEVVKDTSSHAHDLTAVATLPRSTAGVVGGGRTFDGVMNQMCGPDVDQSLRFGAGSFSFEVWVDVTQSVSNADQPLHDGGSSFDPGFDFEFGTGTWEVGVADGTTRLRIDAVPETLGRWMHVVAVVDRRQAAQVREYAFGVAKGTIAIPGTFGTVDSHDQLCFGNGGAPFAGILDEPRIYAEALPDAWIAATYANLANRDHFITVGPEALH